MTVAAPAFARLAEPHVRDLCDGSGLTAETILAAGLYSASGAEATALLGYGVGPALVFPYEWNGAGAPAYARVKLNDAGPDGKRYRSPRGRGNRLYIPPRLIDRALLAEPALTLHITEGEKKTLRALQEGLLCLGLSGVWSWREKRPDGTSAPIADLDRIMWPGRDVRIVFDSDAATNPRVREAERALGAELRRRGATVSIIRLPAGPAGAKQGLDDFLVAHGGAAFDALPREPSALEDAAATAPWAWAISFRGAAIMAATVSRPTCLVGDLFTQHDHHVILGASGSAKTWLLFGLAVAVACPEVTTFLGQPVERHGPVVLESWEQGPDEDLRRLQKLVRGHGLSALPETFVLQSMPLLSLQDEGAYRARLRDLRDHQTVCYLFDSLSEGAGIELNDNTAYSAWWQARVRPLLDLGITVVCTHLRGHLKPGTLGDRDAASRGATQIRGLSTAAIESRYLSPTTSLLIHNKHRRTARLPMGILTLTGTQADPAVTLELGTLPDPAGKADRARGALLALARLHPAAITRKMIEDNLNAPGTPRAARISRKTYNPALTALVLDKTLEAFPLGNADAWRLIADPDEDNEGLDEG